MLEGKLALITGGGRGIGRAIALRFAAQQARVVVAARTAAQVEGVVAEIAAAGHGEALGLVCDVANRESVDQMFADLREHFRADVNILVNNAGVAESATLPSTTDELWQRHLAINLTGTFYCMRN